MDLNRKTRKWPTSWQILLALLCLLLAASVTGSSFWIGLYTALILTAFVTCASAVWRQSRVIADDNDLLRLPLALAHDVDVLDLYRAIGVALRNLSAKQDPIYRELAMERARQLSVEATSISQGQIEFVGTEAWRRSYERLLRSRGLYRYRSAAYVHTLLYWSDEPGRQSMQVNFEMRKQGLQIERIVIVADDLWPAEDLMPAEPIAAWIDEQARNGVEVRLVRASRLEPDLLADFGLYGNRAVGRQEIDDQGRTLRFTLSFSFADLLAAEARWDRLKIYAVSYQDLLDRSDRCT